MGTRCDFYVGRGLSAEWLGSLALDGYPEDNPAALLPLTTEGEFRERVKTLITSRKDGTTPDMGWPWPWENSRLTDYSYAFDGGKVYISWFGGPWHLPGEEPTHPAEGDVQQETEFTWRPCEDPPRVEFPDMTARRNVTLGPRSGLIVLNL